MSIWDQTYLKNQFDENTQYISLKEGNTPVDKISSPDTEILIKREDKNPAGSWKDRGTAYKLTSLINQKIKEAVLFSSGNALISILNYCNQLNLNIKIHAVVSEHIKPEKLEIIQKLVTDKHQLYISKEPKKEAIRISADLKIPNLRVSIDNEIVKGYWSLGFEIYDLIRNQHNEEIAIFVPASSGTALVGIAEGLLYKTKNEFKLPRIFVCQTQTVHPFVKENDEEKEENIGGISTEKSLADAIVDQVGLRVSQVQKIANETNGDIYAITNDELESAKRYVD